MFTVTEHHGRIQVRNEYWEVEHDPQAGGCWTAVRFFHGTRKNLLAGPVSARVRTLEPHPTNEASSPFFYEEKFERAPQVSVARPPSGNVVIVAEGALRLKTGESAGVRYRHRYEYRAWGLVACELEFVCPEGRDDVVEVCALEMPLREGLTDACVREHPTCAPFSDLLGMGNWCKLQRGQRAYAARYVPVHVVCFEKGKEGIEFSCSSDLAAWDTGFSSDPGLGMYELRPSYAEPNVTVLSLCPYCVAYRRNPARLAGTRRLRYSLGLPFVKERSKVFSTFVHAGTGSNWVSDAELQRLAATGVKLIRFHNDYREDGPFWHDGMYPPYDQAGMAELRRIVATAHRLGMKIVPYISVKEFHPASPGFRENQASWRQQPGPAFPEVHTWAGSGEFGQLMCLESGWLDFRKRSIDILLSDLPWDGLYFDWCTPHNCRNPQHAAGALHTDQDAFYDFMFWARERVGPGGFIMSHLSGLPQIVVENMSDIALIYEDQSYTQPYPEPPDFPPQCEFVPITPRHLCGLPNAGTTAARRTIMSGILQGHPPILSAPADAFANEFLAEQAWFAREDLASFRFAPASARAVRTGAEKVYAALWYKPGAALVYVGNYSGKAVQGSLFLGPALPGLGRGRRTLKVKRIARSGRGEESQIALRALRTKGLPYALKPWATALYRVE
ncbi:MAG: hypothetical protein ABSE73_04330 [Planctomycetota bacterium]